VDFFLGAQDPAIKFAAQIQAVAETLDIDPKSVLDEAFQADPTAWHGEYPQYLGWILKQMKFKNVILPEDRQRVWDALELFEQIKRVPQQAVTTDIHRYKTLAQLEVVTDHFQEVTSGRELERPRKIEELPAGASLYKESENYRVLEVTHPDTCIYLSRGTKWCTRELPNADQYIEQYGKLFVILARDRNEWVVYGQYTPNYSQVMDTYNRRLAIDNEELANIIGPDLSAHDAADKAVIYARDVLEGRWLLAEPLILQDPRIAVNYAKYVVRGRWLEGEPVIAARPSEALLYAKHIVKGPWPLGERAIAEDGALAYQYAKEILEDRFPLGEPAIAKLPGYAVIYAQGILNGRFLEAEPFIAQDPEWAAAYARGVLRERFLEGEPAIASNHKSAYQYARDIIQDRWPDGEAAIAQDADTAVAYAEDILGGPFPEGEVVIATDAKRSYMYARDVLRGRFPEGEPAIAKEPQWTFFYARDVIRGRWPEGEEVLYKNKWWLKEYEEIFRS
jgi:hypothetical protein